MLVFSDFSITNLIVFYFCFVKWIIVKSRIILCYFNSNLMGWCGFHSGVSALKNLYLILIIYFLTIIAVCFRFIFRVKGCTDRHWFWFLGNLMEYFVFFCYFPGNWREYCILFLLFGLSKSVEFVAIFSYQNYSFISNVWIYYQFMTFLYINQEILGHK